MNLEKAIKVLTDIRKDNLPLFTHITTIYEAIDTVLKELHTLQMNYKLLEEKFDGSAEEKVDKLTNRLIANTRTIKIKDEYLILINDMLIDYDGCKTVDTLKELIDETREYIHKALKNDDKSVIRVNSKKKFNILGEEVE